MSDVVIKIEVNDADANAKLDKLEARLLKLKAAGAGAGNSFDGLSSDIDRTTSSSDKLNKSLSDNDKHLKRLAKSTGYTEKELKKIGGPGSIFMRVLGGIGKFAKYAAIEFGGMTLVLGGLKLALMAGEYAAKGWNIALKAGAAGVGVLIGGLGTALAAIRELNNARLVPFARMAGQTSADGRADLVGPVGSVMGDRQLGMFDDKTLSGAISAQLKAGQLVDSQFKFSLQALGNFAIGADDPNKALAALSGAFTQARKEGGFTEDIIKQIGGTSEDLASAISSSGMGVDEFTQALIDGRVEGLEAFSDALDVVNSTLIGQAKGAFRMLKEQLTDIGQPLVDGLKPALANASFLLSNFLSSVTPVIQDVLSRLFPQLAGSGDSILAKVLNNLAASINENLPKLEGLMDKFRGGWKAVENFFSKLGDGLRNATSGFDTLYNNILKPLGTELWNTITHAVEGFNGVMNDTSGISAHFAERLHGIFEGVRSLIDGFNQFRTAVAPLVDVLMQLLGVMGKLMSAPGAGFLAALLGSSYLIGGKARKANLRGTTGKSNSLNNIAGLLSFGMYNPLGTERVKPRAQWRQDYATLRGMGDVSRREAFGVMASYKQESIKAGIKAAAPTLLAMGGSIVGGMVLNGARSSDVGAQTLGSALTMGGTGAAIGSMIAPGIGTAIGAGVGVLVGGVSGFFSARAAREKELKEAQKNGENFATAGMNPNQMWGSGGVMEQMVRNRQKIGLLEKFPDMMKQRSELAQSIGQSLADFANSNKVTLDNSLDPGYQLSQIEKDASVVLGIQGTITDLKSLDPAARAEAIKNLRELGTLPDSIKEQLDKFGSIDANVGGIAAQYGASEEEVLKFADGLRNGNVKIEKGIGILQNNYDTLSNVLGMSSEESANFAESIGVNMLERLITFEDVIKGLGYTLDEQGQVMDNAANRATASTRLLNQAMGDINTELEILRQEDAIVSTRNAFFGGGGTVAQIAQNAADYFQSVLQGGTQAYIDSALQKERGKTDKAMTFDEMVKNVLDRLQADYEEAQRNGISGAVEERFLMNQNSVRNELIAAQTQFGPRIQYDSKFAGEAQGILNTQINGILASSGGFQTMEELDQAATTAAVAMRDELKRKYPSMQFDEKNLDSMKRFVLAGMQEGTPAMTNAMITGADYLVGKLASTPIKVRIMGYGDPYAAYREDGMTDEEVQAAAAASQGFVNGKRTGDTSSARLGRIGDTATSQWEKTLGKHMALSAGIPGSRTITSGLRNFNLGSPSSDHLSGNAYDLTGDNLGAYAESVNGAGGFAEFHGAAGSRHLHVVPPAGDTATAVASAMSGMAGNTSNTYSITVVGGSNTNEAELARRVMAEIERRERDRQERR